MIRDSLRYLLESYYPTTLEEDLDREEMLRFLETHADCFDRSCIPGHFTASAWLLNHDGTQALLLHHRKLERWFQLGGHCDGDGDMLAVALKEAREESGIDDIAPVTSSIFDVDIHEIPQRPGEPLHKHYDVRFLLQTQSDKPFVQNSESLELKWFPKDLKVFADMDSSVMRLAQKWIENTYLALEQKL